MRLEQLAALVYFRVEERFVPVQIKPHVHVLRSLPRKHKDDMGSARFIREGKNSLRIKHSKRVLSIIISAAHNYTAMAESFSPDLQGVSDISQAGFRVLFKIGGKIRGRLIKGGFGLCRQHQQMARP